MAVYPITSLDELDLEDEVMVCGKCDIVWADFADEEKADQLDREPITESTLDTAAYEHGLHTDHEPSEVVPGTYFADGELYLANCTGCDERWLFFDQDAAATFSDTHQTHTGHTVTTSPTDEDYRYKREYPNLTPNPFGVVVGSDTDSLGVRSTEDLPRRQSLMSDGEAITD